MILAPTDTVILSPHLTNACWYF